jgi:photosystem II stability/assembly factor-like uncharacterized protein
MSLSRLLVAVAYSLVLPIADIDIAEAEEGKSNVMYDAFQYRNIGPTRGGRVTTVTGTIAAPSTFYLGASGGGVWKTDDYGTSWRNVSDGFFATPSIGDIAVAQNDANIVYVGTGTDGLRSNIIEGKGIYKSIDGGENWQHIGLKKVGQIGAVELDPTNHNIVYVAAIGQPFNSNEERGLFKTIDGGRSWEKVLFISDTVGITDVEIHPSNPNILYASAWKAERKPWTIISGGEIGKDEAGIYKSIDAGASWNKINNGLPTDLVGKIDLATTPADSRILAALVEAPAPEGGLYWSVDGGESFKHISNDKGIQNRPFYYTNLDIDPTNPDIVYSNANPLRKSVDGGKTWTTVSVPHGDNHDMWINPNNPDLFIQANDGGANITHNGGKTWSTQFNQPTSELYTVDVDDQHPYWLYSGMQDNSTTIAVPSMAPFGAQHTNSYIVNTGGCETGPAVPKPGNHNIVYANCKGRFGVYDKRLGTERSYYVGAANIYGHNPANLKHRFQRVAPVHVSPHDSNTVYHGSQYLHRTKDDGVTWETISPDLTANEPDKQVISGAPITRDITGEEYYSTIYSIQESPSKQGVIWVGSNDGVVHVTVDNGANWKNVTPRRLPKGGRVDSLAPSVHNPAKAYITVLRNQLGDATPYIYRTTNYGKSWDLLSGKKSGIPDDYPVRVVRESPDTEGLLFAGTEYGIFLSRNDGKSWVEFQQNLPITPVTDLKFIRGDIAISTMGRGFWVLDNVTSLGQAAMDTLDEQLVVMTPKDTYRYRQPRVVNRAAGFTAGVPDYPKPSVNIDYYVPAGEHSSIRLDVMDNKGQVITSYYNDGRSLNDRTSDTPIDEKSLEMLVAGGTNPSDLSSSAERSQEVSDTIHHKKLEMDEGLNRFNWDMTYLGPWDKNQSRRFGRGFMAAPGEYKVRVSLDGGRPVESELFNLMIDPRLAEQGITPAVIAEQMALVRQVSDLLSNARMLETRVIKDYKSLKKQVGNTPKEERSAEIKVEFERVESALTVLQTEPKVIYPRPRLVNQINFLYNMLNTADQKPGKEFYERFDELKNQYEMISEQYGN